jgi:rod shape-determining protein MreB
VRRHPDIGVDLGTTHTLMYVRAHGVVLSEPSLVAVESETRNVCAAGIEAERLLGREGGGTIGLRPIRNGAITDFDLTVAMLQRFLRKACRKRWARPRVLVVAVPSGATGVERRAVEEACRWAGAAHTYLIEAPMAAAIGAGVAVSEAAGSLVVDIGGGTTEVALISLGEIVVSQSVRSGAEQLDEAIVTHLRRERGLVIGQQVAEEVKRQIGSALAGRSDERLEVPGVDARTALPKADVVTSDDIRGAFERPVARVVAAVKATLGLTPPELASDIVDRGMILTGGGSLLRGLADRLREETKLPAHVAELPFTCVVAGSGVWLEAWNDDRARTSPRLGVSGPASELRRRAQPGRHHHPWPRHSRTPGRPTRVHGRAVGVPASVSGDVSTRFVATSDNLIRRAAPETNAMLLTAQVEATATRETAQVEAAATRETAQREAQALRAAALEECRQLRAAALSEAQLIRADALRGSGVAVVRRDTRPSRVVRGARAAWRGSRRLIEDGWRRGPPRRSRGRLPGPRRRR